MADSVMDDDSVALVKAAKLPISVAAVELIIAEEDSSEAYYQQHYQSPEWPGGASGVTIGLGYDLGYVSAEKIHADFADKVGQTALNAMISVSGIHGAAAHDAMLRVKHLITISWPVALDVFLNDDMPHWIATVRKVLPNTDKLSPDSLGALVSLAYNRGASFDMVGDRYREMRQIKADMASEDFGGIPAQFLSMTRLWPTMSGLRNRRRREAALFKQGLSVPIA
jgi:hypothetical protein